MHTPSTCRYLFFLIILLLSIEICGCAHRREFVYPNGDGRPRNVRIKRGRPAPARAVPSPIMLGD